MVAAAGGLGSSLGVKAEAAFNTYLAPTRWLEFVNESLDFKKTTVVSQGLRAGGYVQRNSRRVVTGVHVDGDVNVEVPTTGFGIWLNNLLGTVSLTQQAATAAWLQVHTVGDLTGKSLTIQKGVAENNTTVVPYSFTGCKVAGIDFSCQVGGILAAKITVDGTDATAAQSLATPSYDTTATLFTFLGGTLVSGTPTFSTTALATGGTAVAEVTAANVSVMNPYYGGRYFGGNGRQTQPIRNAFVPITGQFTADFVDTTFPVAHLADASLSMVLTFAAPVAIASTYYPTLQIAIPAIKLNGELPKVGGPGVVSLTIPFDGLDNGTNEPIYIGYQSTDLAV